MLQSLSIRNVVLIDRLQIDLTPGLTVMTGETGAGKSIVLDALGLALGARADAGQVRKGAEKAQVAAQFDPPQDPEIAALLAEQEIETGDELILRRSLGTDGRSKAFINDQPVSAGLLKQIADRLIEIHGQFGTQALMNPARHRALLDSYAGSGDSLRAVQTAWDAWVRAQDDLNATRAEIAAAKREEEFLRAAVEELESFAPQPDEEDELDATRRRLMNRENTARAYQESLELLQSHALQQAWRKLERLSEGAEDPGIQNVLDTLERAMTEAEEAGGQLESLMHDLEYPEASLEEIEERLFGLRGLARKHQCQVAGLPGLLNDFRARLARITDQETTLNTLTRQVQAAEADYQARAAELSSIRQKAARDLDRNVNAELPPLKLDKARFETLCEPGGTPARDGLDKVAFHVATNPGAAPGPLNKIASGGEMARFMLAIKVVLADRDKVPVLIFDEVDSGIGGATADAVGERLARLAADCQVLVVTHSPQVAARGHHHMHIAKTSDDGDATTTRVVPLASPESRQDEIARMLSGAEITAEARAAAARLLGTRAA